MKFAKIFTFSDNVQAKIIDINEIKYKSRITSEKKESKNL